MLGTPPRCLLENNLCAKAFLQDFASRDVSPGSLTFPAPNAKDVMKEILLYLQLECQFSIPCEITYWSFHQSH